MGVCISSRSPSGIGALIPLDGSLVRSVQRFYSALVIPALGRWMIEFTDTDRLRRVGMGFAIFGLLVVHDEENSGNISCCERESIRESVI